MSHSEIEVSRIGGTQSPEYPDMTEKKDSGILAVEQPVDVEQEDAVFGHLEGGVNYRSVRPIFSSQEKNTWLTFQLGFWGASALLIKTQIGVGVLSFPFTLQVLGLIPGEHAYDGLALQF
jgi:hypothetical protein